ncbi:MAG: hypothetical protein LBN30_03270 [Oscillospiraceae bacterium]|nr:hypothetical protein [Oscillospiraceae bacterium]
MLIFMLAGCNSSLDGEELRITRHTIQNSDPVLSEDALEASDYAELRAAILRHVSAHVTRGIINLYGYAGDVESDVLLAAADAAQNDPVGAYTVTSIKCTVEQIVTYYQVIVTPEYRHTKAETDAIVTASTLRYLRSELLDRMSHYDTGAAILTPLTTLTEADILTYVQEIYYENPLSIVMMPVTTVTIYPSGGRGSRVLDLSFNYRYDASLLSVYGSWVSGAAREIAESARGASDAEILLSLCEHLVDIARYNTSASIFSEYVSQDFSATAYGALGGTDTAIGEGYAMAYKALCDVLALDCHIVRGTLNGSSHAWTIVSIDGAHYHVDPAMCDVNGMSAAFLIGDREMERAGYSWDRAGYPVCDGDLTFREVNAALNPPYRLTTTAPPAPELAAQVIATPVIVTEVTNT